MPTFNDKGGHDWIIRFDGITLGELKDAHGINLADVGGESWVALETDQSVLTKVALFLCRSQLATNGVSQEQFANMLAGEVAEDALQAIRGAAKVFFRPKLWSALESNLKQRMQWQELAPVMALMDKIPEGMREAVLEGMAAKMEAMSGGSPVSTEPPSVAGQAVTLSTHVIAMPEPAASTPAA